MKGVLEIALEVKIKRITNMTEQSATKGFKQSLADGKKVLGTFLKTPTGHATEILGHIGFDYVVVDAEHAPFDRRGIDLSLIHISEPTRPY